MGKAGLAGLILTALTGLAAAQSLTPAAISVDALLRAWAVQNETCRGGAGDDPDTDRACERREAVSQRLRAVGFCYGKESEAGYQVDWHRCGQGSKRR